MSTETTVSVSLQTGTSHSMLAPDGVETKSSPIFREASRWRSLFYHEIWQLSPTRQHCEHPSEDCSPYKR